MTLTDLECGGAKGHQTAHSGPQIQLFASQYDKRWYKRHNRIEIMFGRLKDWRGVATQYDRCPFVFYSALALAAAVLFRL